MKMKKITFFLILLALIISLNSCNKPIKNKNLETANQIKEEFRISWLAYKTYAWKHDGLNPISKSWTDWYEKSLHISPIDAYSTMRVMGLNQEADEVLRYVVDTVNFDQDIFVKTFEVNIRILGGLLSMYQFTMDKNVLAQAEDFGRRMLPAFESPTGIPYYSVNLKTGAVKGERVNVAEGGSYLFEMGILSRFTGNPVYYEKAKRASKAIYDHRSAIGLIGQDINILTGEWLDKNSHIGCCIDSYYEYLFKSWLLLGDPEIKVIWDNSIATINKYLIDEHDSLFWYAQVDMNTSEISNRIVTLYDAYFPALLALSGDITKAEKLQNSWNWLWNKNGLEPSVYDYGLDSITGPNYDLNPEIIESAYYLFCLTGDEKYRQMNLKYWNNLLKYCKNDVAFTSIENVITKERKDYMPTFFFAETLKYLYLTFSPDGKKFLDENVFSTEAHPFKKVKSEK